MAVAVDILSGALSGAGCSREDAERIGNGVFMMAIDIEAFSRLNSSASPAGAALAEGVDYYWDQSLNEWCALHIAPF